MKERPIIFSGEMVRAINDGRKTVTRRVINIQPPSDEYILSTLCDCTASAYRRKIGKHCWVKLCEDGRNIEDRVDPYFSCPYGKVGDRLWVRETFTVDASAYIGTSERKYESFLIIYKAGGSKKFEFSTYEPDCLSFDDPLREKLGDMYDNQIMSYRPSIHMSRWASRITLEITDIRVERINEITDEQAIKEGIFFSESEEDWPGRAIIRFQELWDSINEKRGFPFCDDPFVWVVEFKVV